MLPYLGATMNQFMLNLVCEGFSSCSTEYGHENAEMQEGTFDYITLQYSISFIYLSRSCIIIIKEIQSYLRVYYIVTYLKSSGFQSDVS